MKYILIRDDDITPFTKKDMIERLYEDLFKEGCPVNFSVIPEVAADITFDDGSPYSPYKQFFNMGSSPIIPPEYRDKKFKKSFQENLELLDFLGSLEDRIEILQHGFDHNHIGRRHEFAIYDEEKIGSKLKAGRQIIRQSFNRDPKFFVPPSDSISFVTLKALKRNGYKGISLWKFDALKFALGEIRRDFRPKIIVDDLKALLTLKKLRPGIFRWGDFIILEHPGYILSRFSKSQDIEKDFKKAISEKDIIVIVNHYWEYFFDWGELDKSFFGAWKKMIHYVLDREDCEIVKFSQLYEQLCL
jgi:hypothetical protein